MNYDMVINIKKTDENATIPTFGSDGAACLDLYAIFETNSIDINPGETVKIGTGICMEIPDGYFGAVFARSGLATKRGLRPANCVGVIDSDYRGEIIVAMHNDSDKTETINKGDRVAQLCIIPCIRARLNDISELTHTDRGSGGFGSTGTS